VFIRDSGGTFTTFSAPGAGKGSAQGTIPVAINANDEIVGFYLSSSDAYHGFSRDQSGVITTLDDPHAYKGPDRYFGTVPDAVNVNGEITGCVQNPSGTSGFTVDSSLNYTPFTVPGAVTGHIYAGTCPTGVNDSGTITGSYQDADLVTHGFIRF
jgi:hypothetical protein